MSSKTMQQWIVYLFCLVISGCAPIAPAPLTKAPDGHVEKKELPGEIPHHREWASVHLTEQGRMLLKSGKVDDAISVLEQAVSVYASNGENYYYLAEAWLLKSNVLQAEEWNRLAEMYLAGDREWSPRIYEQRERIRSRGR
ncbi:MAG TPA: hypothetical protein PKV48_02575 [Thermodesulfobacteriota bacterium]|nr:hypothetical protein [Thermodesulfobacteriota bacterium]